MVKYILLILAVFCVSKAEAFSTQVASCDSEVMFCSTQVASYANNNCAVTQPVRRVVQPVKTFFVERRPVRRFFSNRQPVRRFFSNRQPVRRFFGFFRRR